MSNHDHSEHLCVDRFFDACESYWRNNVAMSATDAIMAEDAEIQMSAFRELQAPALLSSQIETLAAASSIAVPEYLVYFLTRHSYEMLETPLCLFASTTDYGQLTEMFEICKGTEIVPFGWSEEYGDHLLGVNNDGMVVKWCYANRDTSSTVVCESFTALLEILIILLRHGRFVWYGSVSGEDQVVIETLREVDARYFGGQAWGWWRGQLIRPANKYDHP